MAKGCTVRALHPADAAQALALYTELTFGPECTDTEVFGTVVRYPGTKVFGGFITSARFGMTTLHLLPNVTWGARPYALIENVVTASDCRNKGVGRAVMQAAIDAACRQMPTRSC